MGGKKKGTMSGYIWWEKVSQGKAEWPLFEELFIPCIRFQLSDQLMEWMPRGKHSVPLSE